MLVSQNFLFTSEQMFKQKFDEALVRFSDKPYNTYYKPVKIDISFLF